MQTLTHPPHYYANIAQMSPSCRVSLKMNISSWQLAALCQSRAWLRKSSSQHQNKAFGLVCLRSEGAKFYLELLSGSKPKSQKGQGWSQMQLRWCWALPSPGERGGSDINTAFLLLLLSFLWGELKDHHKGLVLQLSHPYPPTSPFAAWPRLCSEPFHLSCVHCMFLL